MARIPRNYLAEAHYIGKTYASIARELNRHPSTISKWARGITSPPKSLYEPIRNVSRRTIYKTLREAGYPSYKATEARRFKYPKIEAEIDWIDKIVNTLYNDWKHKVSKKEIRRRIELGLKRGKSKEEIENY